MRTMREKRNDLASTKGASRQQARKLLEMARREDPVGRLPSPRACEARWGISEATFRRARKELEEDSGPVETRPNGKWMQLAERIRSDIASGKLRPGDKLESGLAAAARWAASHPTLRKALRKLIHDGVLQAAPRGAMVPRLRLAPGAKILLVQSCGPDGLVLGEAERMARFRRELELHAHKAGTGLEVWGFARKDRFFRAVVQTAGRIPSFHGVVVSFWDADDPDSMLEPFLRSSLPVAVWDERPQGGACRKAPLLRYFGSSYSSEAGAAMARHLAEMGHRHVAYISPLHGSVWSKMRLRGIREAASARSMEVTECVVSEISSHRALAVPDRNPDQFLKAQALKTHLGAEISRGVAELQERLAILLRLRRMRDFLSPLFSAAQDCRATAWICANDDVALIAWAWLSHQGAEIPARTSIVGFDDTLGAQSAGLTSFHFNEGDLAAAALRHVLAPRRLRANELAGRHTHVSGFVVSRASVRNLSRS